MSDLDKSNSFLTHLPPIWVVNLERSLSRRRFMKDQLDKFNIKYEFINASDGQSLKWKDIFRYSPLHAIWTEGRPLARNEIGCALSHARIYERIVTEQHDVVLILEDDVLLGQDLFEVIQVITEFPDNWELINLLSDSPLVTVESATLVQGKYSLRRFAKAANRTSAYLVNLQGAKKLLNRVYPIRYPADGFQGRSHITGLNLYGILPQPVALAGFDSEIWEDSQPYWEKPLWRFSRNWIRKSKQLFSRMVRWEL